MKISTTKNNYFFLIGIGLLLLSWSLISYFLNQPILVPSIAETGLEIRRILRLQDFGTIVGMTLFRFFLGFFITFLLSAILGIVAGLNAAFASVFSPFIAFIKSVPTMAMILLAIIWLKSDYAPILVVFLIAFPILYANWKTGMEQTDRKLLEMARVYRVKASKIICKVYYPSAKPYLLSGVSSALGLGFKVAIGAEVLCQPRIGIGTAIHVEKSNLNTAGVFAWTIISVCLVVMLERIIKKIFFKRKR